MLVQEVGKGLAVSVVCKVGSEEGNTPGTTFTGCAVTGTLAGRRGATGCPGVLGLTALAATGHADAETIAAERAADDTAAGRTAEIRALASRPDASTRAAAWESAWNDLDLSNDHLDATISGFRAGGRRDLIARFDAQYFERIRGAWAERSIELAQRLVLGLFPASESTDAVDAWLDQNADAPGALRRLVIESRDDLARDLRVRAAQAGL